MEVCKRACYFSFQHQTRQFLRPRRRALRRLFHASAPRAAVKPFLLADIGEGIKEVQIIQWFVQPGARVEQFDKLCEVQSDKAATEITSRFDGVIKKLHYEAEETAQVGKPLCDIDILGDIPADAEALISPLADLAGKPSNTQQPQKAVDPRRERQAETAEGRKREPGYSGRNGSLATPAVRGLLKDLNVRVEDVSGSGKDGRVLKEDVHKYAAERDAPAQSAKPGRRNSSATPPRSVAIDHGPQRETETTLTPIQAQMFKTMTRSLSIPHFLYADEVDLSALSALRTRYNSLPSNPSRLSYLPFVIKAVSIALHDFPLLNARINIQTDKPPSIIMREKHNIGIAMDTPQGLLVPNIKNVAALSIFEISAELARLQAVAQAGKLCATDLTSGTITVSNVGSIGGTYVAPILVPGEVAILGMGRARVVPAFDAAGLVVRKTVGSFSWSADHRVVDGATMARMGERVRELVEEPVLLVTALR